jgi:Family of unknown function (DUF6627)
MKNCNLRLFVFELVSVALVSLGFMQIAHAGIVDTGVLIEQQAGTERLAKIESLLTRDDVAGQLLALGVDPADVQQRVQHLTDAEIAAFEQRLDAEIAGGSAIGVIGTVFLVLLILELVGVTDIFKKI